MWILIALKTGKKFCIFSEKSTYVVGRVGSDIVVKDDSSISRSHAKIELCLDTNSLFLTDIGSRYGTFLNTGIHSNTEVEKNKKIPLRNGDRIRFGRMDNEFKVAHNDIFTMVSSLPKDKCEQVERYVKALGGCIIPKWENCCTHLTMTEITVTIKVLYALIETVPIVSDLYWKEYLEALRSSEFKEIPNVGAYIPKPSESFFNTNQVDFGINSKRKTLFAGKTFVFMCKRHFDMYSEVVTRAGGISKNLNTGVQKSFLIKKNVIVIQFIPSSQSQGSQSIRSVSDYIESKSLRTIPEYEIGLAIVHCTTEKYCNPAHKILLDMMPQSITTEQDSNIFVFDTQPFTKKLNTMSSVEVAETEEKPADGATTIPSEVLQNNIGSYCNLDSQSDDIFMEIPLNVDGNGAVESTNKRKRASNTHELEFQYTKKQNTIKGPVKRLSERNATSSSVDGVLLVQTQKFVNARIIADDCEKTTNSKSSSPIVETQPFPHIVNATKRSFEIENDDESSRPSKVKKISVMISEETEERKKKKNVHENFSENGDSLSTSMSNLAIPKKKTTVSTVGFLQKSQVRNTQNLTETESFEPAYVEIPKKRGRIAVITDEDDGADLFNFGSGSATASNSNIAPMIDQNSDDELFSFERGTNLNYENPKQRSHQDDNIQLIENTTKTRQVVTGLTAIQRKFSPIKITSDGWLSRSLNESKSKLQKSEPMAEDNIQIFQQHQDYITSLKGAFEVRLKNVQIVRRHNVTNNSETAAEGSSSGNVKNFKAFKKKCNYKPQRQVITTIPIPIIPIR